MHGYAKFYLMRNNKITFFNRGYPVVFEFKSETKLFNPLNAELSPICHLLALLGGATIVVVIRLRVKVTVKTQQHFINISILV